MTTEREPGHDGERAELLARLERLHNETERRVLRSLAEPKIKIPLTMQQFKVLAMISIEPEQANAHRLVERLGVSSATMSGIIDRLVDHGVARRVEDPNDRRVRRLEVTDAGRDLIASFVSSAGTMHTHVLERLELEDLRALVRGVTALQRILTEEGNADEAP